MWFVNWFVNLRFVHPASRAAPMISNEASDPPIRRSKTVPQANILPNSPC